MCASAILPQVCLHNGEAEHTLTWTPGCIGKAPILVPLLVGAGIAGAAVIGPSALRVKDKNFMEN